MKDIFRESEKVEKVFPASGKTDFLCTFRLGESPGSLKIMLFENWRETGLDVNFINILKITQTSKLLRKIFKIFESIRLFVLF